MLYYRESEDKENFILSNRIVEIFSKYPIYGYRRITAILNREGVSANHKRVQRLMNEMNLHAIYPRPNTSKKDKNSAVFPYLLGNLLINRPHQVWQVDITYLRTKHGFMYLVALIDVYSRMAVGYRLSNSLCTDSCKSALDDAICKYGAPHIINSDQGSQFTSEAWVKKLSYHKIKISMTGKGRCIDNVYIERLWRAFKYEGSYLYQWNSIEALKVNIPLWINWYNFKRPHQSLDYLTPAEVEKLQLAQMKKDKKNFHLLNDNFNIIKEVNMT